MKKLFAIGLMFLLFALTQSWIPTNTGPIDDDVGICYVAPMDQATVDMVYVADYTISAYPDYRSSVLAVEKADYMITFNSTVGYQDLYVNNIYNDTPANQMTTKNSQNSNNMINRGFRLDIGETLSRAGATARHTT